MTSLQHLPTRTRIQACKHAYTRTHKPRHTKTITGLRKRMRDRNIHWNPLKPNPATRVKLVCSLCACMHVCVYLYVCVFIYLHVSICACSPVMHRPPVQGFPTSVRHSRKRAPGFPVTPIRISGMGDGWICVCVLSFHAWFLSKNCIAWLGEISSILCRIFQIYAWLYTYTTCS